MGVRGQPKKLDGPGLWECALRMLGQRAHSANELRQKLLRRAQSMADLDTTMVKLRDYGLTDDKKFSEAFASTRLQNRGLGRLRVLRELRSKQVPSTIAEKAVEKTFAGTDEADLIQHYLKRKYRGKDLALLLQEEKRFAGVYRRLRTAGFSSSASISVLKQYGKYAEDWNEVEEEEQPG